MVVTTCIRLPMRSAATLTPARLLQNLAVPALARAAPAVRGFTSSTARSDDRTYRDKDVPSEALGFRRIYYLLDQPITVSQEARVEQLDNEYLNQLPLVISSEKAWKPLKHDFPLPRRENEEGRGTRRSEHFAEYVYNTFHFPSLFHLQRFNAEIAGNLPTRFSLVHPVMLMDPKSCTMTIGLPAYIGVQAPFPAKENTHMVREMLRRHRDEATSPEEKKELGDQLRALVVPRGFRANCNALSLFLFHLCNNIRECSVDQIRNTVVRFDKHGNMLGDAAGSPDLLVDGVRQKFPLTDRSGDARRRPRPTRDARKPTAREQSEGSSQAKRLRADDPRLPEAGTFVAQDGDVHKPDSRDSLEEHVPFPKPSPEEMGIKKPTET